MTDSVLVGTDATPSLSAYSTGNKFRLYRFQCLKSGQLNTLHVYATYGIDVKLAVYSDNAGSPGTLLDYTASKTTSVYPRGWNSISVINRANVAAGTYYWLAFASSLDGVYIDNSANNMLSKVITYSGFSFPDPAGSEFTTLNYFPHIYGYGPESAMGCPRQAMHMRRLM